MFNERRTCIVVGGNREVVKAVGGVDGSGFCSRLSGVVCSFWTSVRNVFNLSRHLYL